LHYLQLRLVAMYAANVDALAYADDLVLIGPSARLTVFCVTLGNFLLLLRPGCLLHIVLVSTGVFYGICLAVP